MKSPKISGIFLVALAILLLTDARYGADLRGEITLGMSASFANPDDQMGKDLQRGVLAALERANRAGGVSGQRLQLIVMDDGYEPVRAAKNIRSMLYSPPVSAFIGCGGTAPAVAVLPIIREAKTLFYAPYSGATFLRQIPPERYIINFRVGYAEEAAAMVRALITHAGLKPEEIAFFTQRDGFGDAGYDGGIRALKQYGLTDERKIVHARYERNTLLVEKGLAEILRSPKKPRAIILFATVSPCAKFIRLARHHGLKPLFLTSAIIGDTPLAKALGSEGEGVIVTSAVPHIDSPLPLVTDYREDLKLIDNAPAEPSSTSLESYIAARILLRAIDSIKGPVSRENIIDALENLGTFDMGLGVELRINPDEHQASHHIWPMVLWEGRFEPFSWASISRHKDGRNK